MIAVAIAVGIALGSQVAIVPHIVRGTPYSVARKRLIRSGWRPVKTHLRFEDGTLMKYFGDAKEMSLAGFVEIRDCSGTGRNFCNFVWTRWEACLLVTTYGEYVPEFGGTPRVQTIVRARCQ